uniref:Uncharacterized protein n=1 Tax=Saccharum spontaneum TaxID=62335 RepID=A0A678TGX1_SACSP|nr:hypothetical protein SS75N13_000011 [Saccharum spontaneum]
MDSGERDGATVGWFLSVWCSLLPSRRTARTVSRCLPLSLGAFCPPVLLQLLLLSTGGNSEAAATVAHHLGAVANGELAACRGVEERRRKAMGLLTKKRYGAVALAC